MTEYNGNLMEKTEAAPPQGSPAEAHWSKPDALREENLEQDSAEISKQRPVQENDNAATSGRSRLRPRKGKWFWIGTAAYLIVLNLLFVGLQAVLWNYLDRFQQEQNAETAKQAAEQAAQRERRRAPQLTFEDWQKGLTADYWTDLWYEQAPSDLDVREQVYAYMAERFAPDAIKAFKAAEFTYEAPVYVLKNGEEALARITLSGSELDWIVSQVELLIEGSHCVSVTVADSYHVFCNGRELGGEYAEQAASRLDYDLLSYELEGSVTWLSYNVEGLLLEPELTVEPPEGYGVIRNESGDYLLCLTGDNSAYTNKAVAFVKAYLSYFMSGEINTQRNLDRILALLTPGTQAYRDLNGTYNGVIWSAAYGNIDTSQTFAGDVIVWADNCYSVDVTYNADCTMGGEHVDYADGTMRVYFMKGKNGFVLTNFLVL